MTPAELVAHFRDISPQQITTLSSEQTQKLLTIFHSEMNRPNEKLNKKMKKHNKIIRKQFTEKIYKNFIKDNISDIICKSMERVRGIHNKQHNKEVANLKMRFASETSLQLKAKKFQHHLKNIAGEANKDQLTCPICLELLVYPSLTACGHVFCSQCLDQSLLFSNNCPNCRQNIKGSQVIVCKVLDKLIRRNYAPSFLAEHKTSYQERINRFQEWKKAREVDIKLLQIGQIIDVRDTESIWCQGKVLEIYYRHKTNEIEAALIHYDKWHKLYNQIIDLPSARLAPHGLFSTRVDIPRYNLAEDSDNMRGSVVSGPRIIQQTNFIEIPEMSDSESEEEQLEQLSEQSGDNHESLPQFQAESQSNNFIPNGILQNWHFIRFFRQDHHHSQPIFSPRTRPQDNEIFILQQNHSESSDPPNQQQPQEHNDIDN